MNVTKFSGNLPNFMYYTPNMDNDSHEYEYFSSSFFLCIASIKKKTLFFFFVIISHIFLLIFNFFLESTDLVYAGEYLMDIWGNNYLNKIPNGTLVIITWDEVCN